MLNHELTLFLFLFESLSSNISTRYYKTAAMAKNHFKNLSKLNFIHCGKKYNYGAMPSVVDSSNEFTCKYGACIPNYYKCDGFPDCLDASDEEVLICANERCPVVISFQCAYGGCIESERKCNGIEDCLDGSDEDTDLCGYPPTTRDECERPTKLTNARCQIIDCSQGYRIRDCTARMETKDVCVQLYCDEGYVLNDYKGKYTSKCTNGEWTPEIPICRECGIDNRVFPLLANALESPRPVPWHVGLYRVTEGEWHFFCGGTIVHSKAVVTAAHCLKEIGPYGVPADRFPMNELWIAAGKMYRDFYKNETYEQKVTVLNIKINDYDPSSYRNDIAILILNEKLKINPDIVPICLETVTDYLDYKRKPNPSIGGTIVGWGLTENSVLSDRLREANFHICCDYLLCKQKVNSSVWAWVTADKFCIYEKNGTAVESGDSGGGFTIRDRHRYYLYGVVSAKSERMRLFTLVAYHWYWLYKELDVF